MIQTGRVYGFTGQIGAGKTEAAHLLQVAADVPVEHIEMETPVLQVAQGWMHRIGLVQSLTNSSYHALSNVIRDVGGRYVSPERLEAVRSPELLSYIKDRPSMTNRDRFISRETMPAHRVLIEALWTGFSDDVGGNIWADFLLDAYVKAKEQGAELITVSGLRYAKEAQFVRESDGYNLLVSAAVTPERDDVPSIPQLRPVDVDSNVTNYGTLDDLSVKMASVWKDASERGYLQDQY